MPLRRRLLAIALAGILPLAVVAGLGLASIFRDQQRQAEHRSLEVTRLTATAIEVELSRSTNVLVALAQSPMLDVGDLAGFAELMRRILPSVPGWHAVNIATPAGEVLLRLSREGEAASGGTLGEPASFARVVETGQPQVGHLGAGPRGTWGIPLRVPVLRDGQMHYVLTAVLRPEVVLDVISTRRLPSNWVTTVLDGNGRRIARTHQHEKFFALAASPTLAELLKTPASQGVGETDTLEGVHVYTAFVRLEDPGWIVATGIPTHEVAAGAATAFTIYGGGLALSLLLASGAALFATRRIIAPIHELRSAAHAIGQRKVPDEPVSEIVEIREVGQALVAAAAERRHSELERDRLLVRLEAAQRVLTQQVADLRQLHALNERLLSLPELEDQLATILAVLCDLHGSKRGVVSLSDGKRSLQVKAAQGLSPATLALLDTVHPGQGACGTAVLEKNRVVIEDTERDPRFAEFVELARTEGFRALHSTPLQSSAGGILGAITVAFATPRPPTDREVQLADLCAALAALYIERAQAQEEAGRSEQQLQVALDSSTVPFIVATPLRENDGSVVDFRCDFVNESAAARLGYAPAELAGALIGKPWRHGPLQAVLGACQEAVGRQRAVDMEFQQSEDGSDSWFHIVATPFQQSVALWFADITERKQQEQMLQEADRRKDEFLATLAHELRNPLAPIRQAAALASAPTASESQKHWGHSVIERQVKHMALLLDDLLDISRITLGKLTLRKTTVVLQDVLKDAIDTNQPQLDMRRHHLQVAVPDQPVKLEADALRLEQILGNLLTNAAKYTDEGGTIELTAAVGDGTVEIGVADTGVGIAAEHLADVFEIFAQVPDASDRSGGGLGIGLALSRGLARLHGGDITAASAGIGKGSRFVVTLPLGVTDAAVPPQAAPEAMRGVSRRVLVVDDNRDIAETMGELLRLEGHEVCLAFDGQEALAAYRRFAPAVVLMDIGMPGLSGDAVARLIRAEPDGAQILLVAITGWGQHSDKENALAAGFDRHLTKPVDFNDILSLLEAPQRA